MRNTLPVKHFHMN